VKAIKFLLFSGLIFSFFLFSFAQDSKPQEAQAPPAKDAAATAASGAPEAARPESRVEVAVARGLSSSSNVTLDFKEADIQNVLKIISYKSGVNIVTTPDVIGNISIRLVDVPWETALDVMLKTYGFAYQRQGNIILVTKLENISKIQAEEPLQTEIFNLKFLDAQDAEKILIPLLSPRGKISVLYARGQKGWKFGTFQIGKEESRAAEEREKEASSAKQETISIEKNASGELISKKAEFEPSVKSKTVIITDTASSLDRIRNVILPQIDRKPKQVLIETRIMEVNRDKLKDLGVDWGTGRSGATTYTTAPGDQMLDRHDRASLAGRNLASEFTPSVFGPLEGTTLFPGKYPYAAGFELLYKKLTGFQFEVIIHALEEDAHTNTLSAPRILTLDNQEASILVGYHTPILSSSVTAGTDTTGPTQTQTLDYYQEIGIRLNVVPQISEEGYINMIIHPSITSSTSSVTATNVAGTGGNKSETTISYPIIDVREAQTQVLMKDGETIILGGLLKDVKSKESIGIPVLSKIPFLGPLFRRDIDDVKKIDLLICISARVVRENELSAEEIAKLEAQLGQETVVKKEVAAADKKKKKNKK
jgi:type IV pilus assembly protein PilQ